MSTSPIFDDAVVGELANDIWANARLHADERKSGESLNSERMIAKIQRGILSAASVYSARLVAYAEDTEKLKEQIGILKGEIKSLGKERRLETRVDSLTNEVERLKKVLVQKEAQIKKMARMKKGKDTCSTSESTPAKKAELELSTTTP